MKSGENKALSRIYNVAKQCIVIAVLVEGLFASAYNSTLYQGWSDRLCRIIKGGNMLFASLTIAFFAAWAVGFVMLKKWKQFSWDIAGIGLMIVVHYLIRIRMIGTMPMDDGRIYYIYLRNLVSNPEILLDNFYEGGRMAAHIAHGYAFLCMIGEFLMPGTAFGFQWVQLFMGIAAACCIYGIMRRLFTKVSPIILWIASFVVSVQPMFLGLSTMCNLEYAITVYFIYTFYCYLSHSYILMLFWLVMLGTTKETGTAMAAGFIMVLILSELVAYIRKHGVKTMLKKLNAKWLVLIVLIVATTAVGLLYVLNMEVWGGTALKDVINFGGSGNMTFNFKPQHFLMKLGQLYILNFSWIWLIIVILGLVVLALDSRAKSNNRIPFKPLFILITCYLGYTFFLILYQEAKQPRYNMLSDVLFSMFAVFMLLKLFERRHVLVSVLSVTGLLMFGEAFVTIDPISAEVFTNVNTNSFPMVFTATFKWEQDTFGSNAGDFAFYNYQYTFIDKALDDILSRYSWKGSSRILSASANIESQLLYDELRWDPIERRRGYDTDPDSGRFWYIRRDNVLDMLGGNDWPDSGVLIESPWCIGDLDTAVYELSKYYDVEGPYESKQGFAGSVIYYFVTLRK